jgi:hypothetical protein
VRRRLRDSDGYPRIIRCTGRRAMPATRATLAVRAARRRVRRATGSAPISTTPAPAAATETPAQIAQSAATQSSTPGAAPTEATANQGTQDVVRNSWLQQATQSTQVDPNDPNIKQQVDPFAAQQERQRRDYESAAAERLSASRCSGFGADGAGAPLRHGARGAGHRHVPVVAHRE